MQAVVVAIFVLTYTLIAGRRLHLLPIGRPSGALLGAFLMGFAALGGLVAFVVLEREDPQAQFARVDWSLLIFLAALFVVVAGLATTGLVDAAWRAALTSLYLVGSNLVSNVAEKARGAHELGFYEYLRFGAPSTLLVLVVCVPVLVALARLLG